MHRGNHGAVDYARCGGVPVITALSAVSLIYRRRFRSRVVALSQVAQARPSRRVSLITHDEPSQSVTVLSLNEAGPTTAWGLRALENSLRRGSKGREHRLWRGMWVSMNVSRFSGLTFDRVHELLGSETCVGRVPGITEILLN